MSLQEALKKPGTVLYGSQSSGQFYVTEEGFFSADGRQLPTDPEELERRGIRLSGSLRDAIININVKKRLEAERMEQERRFSRLREEEMALFAQREKEMKRAEAEKFPGLPDFDNL